MKSTGPLPRPRSTLVLFTQLNKPDRVLRGLWFVVILLGVLVAAPMDARQQQGASKDNMAGMDMSGDMKDMGPSMAAMAGHMYVTSLRPKQPGDEEKVKAIVAQVKSIDRALPRLSQGA